LKIVAARAPRNLRRHTARILICDEADATEIGAEGNPIKLAERRTLTFSNRKIVIGSTPIFDDTSHVPKSYRESDQRVFEIPCLTVGGDVQDDRIEATVCGWTRNSECLVLGHFIIWGSFADQGTWDEMDELLRTKWRHPLGGLLKADAAVLDAGDGDHYDAVMNFCVPKLSRRVFPGKGLFGARPGFAMA